MCLSLINGTLIDFGAKYKCIKIQTTTMFVRIRSMICFDFQQYFSYIIEPPASKVNHRRPLHTYIITFRRFYLQITFIALFSAVFKLHVI